jgi:elongation factor P hydroxylase
MKETINIMNKGFSGKKNMKVTKVTKDELKNLQDQEQKKQAILHDLGLLATQSHTLSHMFAELALASETNKKAIEEKYGNISIDLNDGSYETIKDEENK